MHIYSITLTYVYNLINIHTIINIGTYGWLNKMIISLVQTFNVTCVHDVHYKYINN